MVDHHALLALDAAIIDTETTGLDPAKARIVQIGGVRLSRGRLLDQPVFDRKIDPGVPIPPETTRIHGIDAAAIAGAPRYGGVHDALAEFIGSGVLIGHNIGFDLAILEREAILAGKRPLTNAILDTRLLGEICFPRLGGFTLDVLAAHLKIGIDNRHDALADATLTGRVFLALIPALKAHGIRSLAEAETACRRLTSVLDDYNRAGWREPVRPKLSPDNVLARIDAFPFRHRVKDVAAIPPVWIGPDVTLGEAATLMAEKRISSVFVSGDAASLTVACGIITERDVIRLVGENGAASLAFRAGDIASRPLMTIPAEAFVYRAIGRMEQHHIRHLGVVSEDGGMVGALSARDLLRLRASDALALGDAIDSAADIGELAGAWSRMPRVAKRLMDEGISARETAAVISREIGALTRRAAIEAEARMKAEGQGAPPAPYAVLILGSGGRGESLLIPDQDNAIVFSDGENGEACRDWFTRMGAIMNAVLDDIGIPLCKGGVMAGNPVWNGSLGEWQARIRGWTETTTPDDLLSVDIFFDLRFVHGDAVLAQSLRETALAMAREARPMVKLLADAGTHFSPPIGLFGRLGTEEGRIDLKKGGLFPIVAAARCLALAHGVAHRATADRLAALREMKIGADQDLDMLDQAHAHLAALILAQQITDISDGKSPSTRVEVGRLTRGELARLKQTLSGLGSVSAMVHDLLFARPHP